MPNNKLQEENNHLKLELLHIQMELAETKSKYEQLCGILKKTANEKYNKAINEGDHFLWNYAHERKGPWN
jgi:hypothetical protein